MILIGGHQQLDYDVVGLGAAAYSHAKYGILTELLPPSQLVKANGWIEGLTIGSIILGILLGGQLVGPRVAPFLLGIDIPYIETGIDTSPEVAIASLIFVYVLAAIFNLYIPRTETPLQPLSRSVPFLVRDFSSCNARLWDDKLGQISLATTTMFWVSAATCASSCSPGRPQHWATPRRRPRRSPARCRSAWRSVRCSLRCACGWTAPPA